jgi:hypothetical protein
MVLSGFDFEEVIKIFDIKEEQVEELRSMVFEN